MDEIATRIFELVDEQYKEQKDFASAIGESPSLVSQWRNGITKSYTKRIDKIAKALNTSTEWLLTGDGPRKKSPTQKQRSHFYRLAIPAKMKHKVFPAVSDPASAPIDQVEPELLEYLDQLRNRDEMRLLFSVTKGATKEQVEAIVKMIESMQSKS